MKTNNTLNLEKATFGAGCFWCVEGVFQRLKGVSEVRSGYAGGQVENPTYEQVCSGNTGHAEVVQLEYDPAIISFAELLEVFWKTHDPTTLNKQGNDIGTQYRSSIFYHSDEQMKTAEAYMNELNEAGIWPDPVVTEIVPFSNFYEAEPYHRDYYNNNPEQGYCRLVIQPKLAKFSEQFKNKLKA